MKSGTKMYEVLISDDSGTQRRLRFRLLEDALRYADAYAGAGSIALRKPNGDWQLWERDDGPKANRRNAPRLPTRAECVLQLAPGRRNTSHAEATLRRSKVLDAGPGGAQVLLEGEASWLNRGDLVAFAVVVPTGDLTLPARVAWTAGERIGLSIRMPSPEAHSNYMQWLERAAYDAIA